MKKLFLILSIFPIISFGQNKVGIGTNAPDSTFQVSGGLKFVTGRQASGKVLTSDANGGADWILPSNVGVPKDSLQVYTAGSTISVANGVNILFIDPSTTQAALTITLPAIPSVTNEISIYFGGTMTSGDVITALTISPNTSQAVLQSSSPTNVKVGEAIIYKWRASNAKWYRQELHTAGTIINSVNFNPNLIELLGQSNAAGSCAIANVQSDLTGPQTGSHIFNTATLTWQTLEGGVNNSALAYGHQNDAGPSFGVELRLMKLLREHYNLDNYMIKYALGGTALAQDGGSSYNLDWSQNSAGADRLFDQSNRNHDTALLRLNDNRPPKAIIWIQGEQDSYYSAQAANSYLTNLQNFVAAKRAAYGYPHMPFILVRLGDLQNNALYVFKPTVRAAEETLATQPYNYLISADGQTTTDGSHYTAAGYDTIAHRIYDLLITL